MCSSKFNTLRHSNHWELTRNENSASIQRDYNQKRTRRLRRKAYGHCNFIMRRIGNFILQILTEKASFTDGRSLAKTHNEGTLVG